MNDSCVDKINKGGETQQEYGSSLIEMTPLFHSLHVSDAGKTGLMSNRVALHEQFTVSLQRFAQLSAPCRPSASPYSSSEECALKECHQLSTSHMRVVPISSKAQGFACPFFGTTDGTTVCNSKSAGSNAILDTVAMTTKGDNLKHRAAKTADAQLPSSSATLDKAESNDGQSFCDTPAADMMMLVEGAQYLSIGDGLQNVFDLRQAGLAPQFESNAYIGCESAEVGGKVIAKDDVLLPVSKQDEDTSCKEHNRRTMRVLSSECCSDSIGIKNTPQAKGSDIKRVPFDRPMINDVEVPGPCSAEGCMVIIEDEHWKENLPDARCARDSLIRSNSICQIEVETALPGRDIDVSTKPLQDFSAILDTSNRESTRKAARETPCFPVRSNCGACGESANKNSCHCGVAESIQEDIEMGNDLNDSESSCAFSLSPKAVIQEIGQLRFWKVRLALMRQQRIFSDQVFELHKLIQVQRLLAGTPYTSIDEIYFGVGNMNLECEADALVSNRDLVDKEENVGDARGKQILVLEQTVEFPTVVGKTKTKSINRRAHLQQSSAVPGVEKGGVSARGYPSLGAGHWTGSLPAAGACPYPPLAGGFAPGSAVGGPFAAPVLGLEGTAMIRSPISAFSFPVCSQTPQFTQSVQSRYGSAIASTHRQHSAPYHNPLSGHEVSNCAGPQTLNKMHGAAEGPTASVATISSQPDTSQQKLKVKYPSSFISQMYLQEEEMQADRKGLTMSGSKPEDLQCTVTGLNSSSARPANDSWECSEHNEQGLCQALDLKHHNYNPGKKESLFKEESGFKRDRERKQQDLLTTGKLVDVNNSLNPSLGPLNLFPLAPTLSLDEHSKRRPLGGAKEWQGHVIKVVPRAAISTPESAAGILLSLQQERKPQL